MTKVLDTPSIHSVFNELDKHGVLLDLVRLSGERNAAYKRRLLDVYIHRGGSHHLGLIYGITRELGLQITDVLKIKPVTDGNGVPLLTQPAIVFEETLCTLYSDFTAGTELLSLDRFCHDDEAFTIAELVSRINETGYFTATVLNNFDTSVRSMTIFNQTSVDLVEYEDISGKGIRVKLEGENLIDETISIQSPNLKERVSTEVALVKSRQYYIDPVYGIILSTSAPAPGSAIRYRYRNDDFIVKSSPVILHNLQSSIWKQEMYQDHETSGLPTNLGADIINELLSVAPTGYGL